MIKLIGLPFDENSSFLQGPALAPDIIRHKWHDGSSNDYAENLLEKKENTKTSHVMLMIILRE